MPTIFSQNHFSNLKVSTSVSPHIVNMQPKFYIGSARLNYPFVFHPKKGILKKPALNTNPSLAWPRFGVEPNTSSLRQ